MFNLLVKTLKIRYMQMTLLLHLQLSNFSGLTVFSHVKYDIFHLVKSFRETLIPHQYP